MDFREFDFWLVEAGRARIRRELTMMEHIRYAMWAEGRDFASFVHEMRSRLMTAEEKKSVQDAAWLRLRTIGSA